MLTFERYDMAYCLDTKEKALLDDICANGEELDHVYNDIDDCCNYEAYTLVKSGGKFFVIEEIGGSLGRGICVHGPYEDIKSANFDLYKGY